MASKMVYLVSKVTAAMREFEVPCVDDKGLNALMADENLEVQSTLPSKKVSFGGKPTKVTPMMLRTTQDHQGLTVAGQQASSDLSSLEDGPGGQGGLKALITGLSAAIQRSNDPCHLGGARDHSMPGLTIISGEVISKAYDAGMLAQRRGEGKASCPFPSGSEAAVKWRQGWEAGSRTPEVPATKAELARIEEDAYNLAKSLGRDDEVSPQYPAGSQRRKAWEAGFIRGGGREV